MKQVKFISIPLLTLLFMVAFAVYTNSEVRSGGSADSYAGGISEDGTKVVYWEAGTGGTHSKIIVKNSTGGTCNCSNGLWKVSRASISEDGNYVAYYAQPTSSDGLRPYLCQVNFSSTPTPDDIWDNNDGSPTEVFDSSPQDDWAPAVTNSGYVAFEDPVVRLIDPEEPCGGTNGKKNNRIWLYKPGVGLENVVYNESSEIACSGGQTPAIARWTDAFSDVRIRVAYVSASNDLPSDTGEDQIYETEWINGTRQSATLVSKNNSGTAGDDPSKHPDISKDGNLVAFTTLSENFGVTELNDKYDVYVRNISAASIARAYDGNNLGDTYGDHNCDEPKISPTENSTTSSYYVAFFSQSQNLVTSGVNYSNRLGPFVFVSRLSNQTTQLASHDYGAAGSRTLQARNAERGYLSGQGTSCVFDSSESDIASGGSSTYRNVYRVYGGP